ncbi:MAG: DNA polymerase III subunit gamma/tau [Kiritimatiellae bacterium]|nr:DNA polymerase III subunit gamma/tau [Kiritimatiellia bacterium]
MSYEVLARKWRPQQFDDVVGQGHVVQTLGNAIAAQRVAHAYLFVGPRGVGKTSIARIFAKALNCPNLTEGNPCDTCDSCREIMSGVALDVVEIDGASNNSVDQVRELRDSVKYAPARGPNKIYIIDEVHMLSMAAFNALLKTLEEPPGHVKFLFATTEVQKVPSTILSRCQRFDLRRIELKDLIGQLRMIAGAEDVEISDEAVEAIARGAEGGLRDAESALDQLISFRGKKIDEEDVLNVFGLVSRRTLEDLAEAVLSGNYAGIFEQIADLNDAGKDLQRLSLEVLDYMRNLLVVQLTGDRAAELEIPESHLDRLKVQAAQSNPERLSRVVDILIQAQPQLKFALSRRTILEMALLRAARAAAAASLDDILAALQETREALPEASREVTSPTTQKKSPEGIPAQPGLVSRSPVADSRVREVPAQAGGDPEAHLADRAEDDPVPDPEKEYPGLVQDWPRLIEKIGQMAPLTRGYLKDTRPLAIEGTMVILAIDEEFAGNQERLLMPRNLHAIKKAISNSLHRSVNVSFQPVADLSTIAIPTLPGGGTDPERSEEPVPPKTQDQRHPKAAVLDDPAVKNVLEAFDGNIIDIR